mmetsp:Transcript_24949/g.34228  ORF Transcript_24949/g.34228 Transcript_24949/m.34228 type:complete len:261 (+) Transcript_24949:1842-2624(+)
MRGAATAAARATCTRGPPPLPRRVPCGCPRCRASPGQALSSTWVRCSCTSSRTPGMCAGRARRRPSSTTSSPKPTPWPGHTWLRWAVTRCSCTAWSRRSPAGGCRATRCTTCSPSLATRCCCTSPPTRRCRRRPTEGLATPISSAAYLCRRGPRAVQTSIATSLNCRVTALIRSAFKDVAIGFDLKIYMENIYNPITNHPHLQYFDLKKLIFVEQVLLFSIGPSSSVSLLILRHQHPYLACRLLQFASLNLLPLWKGWQS